MPPPWAVIAGGGTGGHVYPGLALASELVRRGHAPATVRFIGSRRGLEATSGVLRGFPLALLPGRGWQRGGLRRSALPNVEALAGAAAAVVAATWLLRRWRPAVVVSLGGYASLPAVVGAALSGVPVVVVNLDAVPGLVNRLAARVAVACAEGTPGPNPPGQTAPGRTGAFRPGPASSRPASSRPASSRPASSRPASRKKAFSCFTGVPVRPELAALDRSPLARRRAKERLGVPPGTVLVAVSGGSLGALRLNRATARLAELWEKRPGVAVRHVVGRRDWDLFGAPRAGAGPALHVRQGPRAEVAGLLYQVVEYEEDMAGLYCAADVAVQRSGASAVAELALAGVPSVLVPLPGAPGDHQGANARSMAAAGGAVVVSDRELDGERLAHELDALLSDPARLASMEEGARALARPEAAALLADLVERSAARGRQRFEGEVVSGAG